MTGFVIGVVIVLGLVGCFWIVKFTLDKRKKSKESKTIDKKN